MTTTVIDFCTPPVPGERHKYYGDAHNKFIKLPQLAVQSSPAITTPTTTTTNTTVAPVTRGAESNAAITTLSPRPSPQPAESTTHGKKIEQQKTLHSLASTGNLAIFKQVLQLLPDPLKAVNDPHPSTGLTPIHFAASRGHVEIVRCLVEDYHVSVDSRDKEGETPLLKASYAGHFHVVQYLLSKKANIHQKDKDGWSALHNACSRGNLPIVRLLVERNARVNAQNKTGHTPLINAASKGHMSIVEYLLEEANANPLIKNNFQEAAYDVSAASGEAGEAYICEMLEKAGTNWWPVLQMEGEVPAGSTYELHEYHVTVMVIIHENQRSSSLLGLSRPQFSAAALTKREHEDRGPWSLHPFGIPTSKETVSLPQSTNSRVPGGSNWFWLTDWQIDYSDPRVDPTSGWQYSRSFDDDDQAWTPVAPTSGYGWVRRRRWVRVMKRRMDLVKGNVRGDDDDDTNLPNDATMDVELQKDYLEQAEELVQNAKNDNNEAATTTTESTDVTTRTIRQLTTELRVFEEAVQMLLAGIKTDTNQFRKHQATILVKSHTAHIESLNARITALGSKLSTPVGPVQHNPELARELGFSIGNDQHGALNDLQATTSTTDQRGDHQTIGYIDGSSTGMVATDFDANPWSRDSGNSEAQPTWVSVHDQQQHESSSLNHVDLLGHDDNNGDDDALAVSRYDDEPEDQGLRAFEWEADINAKECRRCARRFGILVRRHHCRRCGLIVCDRCSASRTYLNASEILQDPNGPRESVQVLATQHHRVCDKCYADLGLSQA